MGGVREFLGILRLPLAVAALILLLRRRTMWAAVCALCVVPLLPVLGIVPFLYQRASTVADRYVYLSMLGVALAVSLGLRQLLDWSPASRIFAAAGTIAASVLLGGLSFHQVGYWRGSLDLWSHAMGAGTNIAEADAHTAWGWRTTRRARTRTLSGSSRQPSGSIRTMPGHSATLPMTVSIRAARRRNRAPRSAISLLPTHAGAHNSLGCAYRSKGLLDKAFPEFQEAIRLDPMLVAARLNLAIVYCQISQFDKAAATASELLDLNRNNAQAHALMSRILDNRATTPRQQSSTSRRSTTASPMPMPKTWRS